MGGIRPVGLPFKSALKAENGTERCADRLKSAGGSEGPPAAAAAVFVIDLTMAFRCQWRGAARFFVVFVLPTGN